MFNPKEKSKSQRSIESELERVLTSLRTEMIHSEEYAKTLSLVERLNGLMDKEKPSTVSKDTALTVAANLVGIILIIRHEHLNVITSKALSFVIRAR